VLLRRSWLGGSCQIACWIIAVSLPSNQERARIAQGVDWLRSLSRVVRRMYAWRALR
jgi:hypothetical protein